MAQPTENEILAGRRARLEQLQKDGRDPFAQTRFERTHLASEIHANYPDNDGQEVRVAGRIKTKRGQGKISFADLYDPTGKIQLVAQIDKLGDDKMTEWLSLELGDIVGISGYPTLLFAQSNGKPVASTTGYLDAPQLVQTMQDAFAKWNNTSEKA